MLTEIYSEAFQYGNKKERGPIALREGLNVVLGNKGSDNSIGKSSFLLAIDFALGGNTYPTKEIKNQVKDHRICWTIEFAGKKSFFCRWTNEKEYVRKCEQGYKETGEVMGLDDYISFLYDGLNMSTDEREYRILTSVFLRIHPKFSNQAISAPLASYAGENEHSGLLALEKIMNKYEAIKKENEAKEAAKEKSSALTKAESQKVIIKLTKDTYELNEEKRKQLEEEILQLGYKEEQANAKKEDNDDQTYADINRNIQTLRSRRSYLYYRRKLLTIKEPYSIQDISEDLEALNRYLNDGVKVEEVEKVQNFQIKLQKILAAESQQEIESIEKEISEINQKIELLSSELVELSGPSTVPQELVNQIAEKRAEIIRLNESDQIFLEREKIRDGVKTASAALKEVEKDSVKEMEKSINDTLAGFIDEMFKSDGATHSKPYIDIFSSDKYQYNSYNDGGNGTAWRDLILFDLAMMKITSIPFIAHDNNLTKNVEDDTLFKLFPIYQEVSKGKQIFLAFDGLEKFNNPDLKKEMLDSKVLELEKANDDYLYGFHFDVVRPEEKPKEAEPPKAEQMSLFDK
jgi:hypothetical protein